MAAGHSGQFTPCGYLSTHTTLVDLEPATFRSLIDCWSDALPVVPPTGFEACQNLKQTTIEGLLCLGENTLHRAVYLQQPRLLLYVPVSEHVADDSRRRLVEGVAANSSPSTIMKHLQSSMNVVDTNQPHCQQWSIVIETCK